MNAADLVVRITADIAKFQKEMEKGQTTIDKVAGQMAQYGKKMTLAVSAPLVGAGTAAAKFAIDYESAFAGVRKTTDATEEELSALSKGIREMALELPASAVEIAGVAEAAGQLGIQTDAILGFTRTM
nr:phage tail tape measure protein [Candidatus Thermoplasmatota archaeon]